MRAPWLLAALGLAIVVACGDDDPGTGGGSSSSGSVGDGGPSGPPATGAPVAEADFAKAFVAAFCEPLQTCCTKYSVEYEKATCEKNVTDTFGIAANANVARGAYDPTAAGNCLARIRSVYTACDRDKVNQADLAELTATGEDGLCPHVYKGTKSLGQKCEATIECTQAAGTVVRCDGICREVRTAKDGEACNESLGEDDPPGPITLCVSPSECLDKKCGSRKEIADGQPCGLDNSTCKKDSYCKSGSSGSTCAPSPKVGEVCDNFCTEGNFCSNKVCKAKLADGAACKSSSDCLSKRCFHDKCFSEKMLPSPQECSNPLK